MFARPTRVRMRNECGTRTHLGRAAPTFSNEKNVISPRNISRSGGGAMHCGGFSGVPQKSHPRLVMIGRFRRTCFVGSQLTQALASSSDK